MKRSPIAGGASVAEDRSRPGKLPAKFCPAIVALTVKVLPVGIVYALWSGMGIVLIASIGWAFLGQRLDAWAILGLGLILAGVVVINTLSKSVPHG